MSGDNKIFENSRALRKGLQRFGLHHCDCDQFAILMTLRNSEAEVLTA